MTNYEQGFIDKCAQHNVDATSLLKRAGVWETVRRNGLDSLLDVLKLKQLREGVGQVRSDWGHEARVLGSVASGRDASLSDKYRALMKVVEAGGLNDTIVGGSKGTALYGTAGLGAYKGLDALLAGEEAPQPRYHN